MGVVNVKGTTYHMNDKLKKKWDKIKDGKLKKIDEDRVYATDGRERTGKSLFILQQAAYIDDEIIEDMSKTRVLPRMTELLEKAKSEGKTWEDKSEWRDEAMARYKNKQLLPQIVFSAKDFLNAVRELKSTKKRTKVLDFDEAFRGMSSKGSLSKENKKLVQALMEMGQSNLTVFVVSPSFFLLELYVATLRSNALFHVIKDKKSGKRVIRIFNYRKKAKLYQLGIRKGWGYGIKTSENANFYNIYPGGEDFEWRYRLKKQLSLRDMDEKEKPDAKYKIQRDNIIYGMYKEIKSLRKLSEKLKEYGFKISPKGLSLVINLYKEEDEKKEQD